MKVNLILFIILSLFLLSHSSCRMNLEKRRYSDGYYFIHNMNFIKCPIVHIPSDNLEQEKSKKVKSEGNYKDSVGFEFSCEAKAVSSNEYISEESYLGNNFKNSDSINGKDPRNTQVNIYRLDVGKNQVKHKLNWRPEELIIKQSISCKDGKSDELTKETKRDLNRTLLKSILAFIFILLALICLAATAIDFILIFFILFLVNLVIATILAISGIANAYRLKNNYESSRYKGKSKIIVSFIFDYLTLILSAGLFVLLFTILINL